MLGLLKIEVITSLILKVVYIIRNIACNRTNN